jgi:hypothetical protein
MSNPSGTSLSERLESIISEKRIKSSRAFALSINVDPSLFAKVLKGEREISDSMVKSISEKYNINPDWLLLGHGEKYGQSPNFNEGLPEELQKTLPINIPRDQQFVDIIQTKAMVKTLLHVLAEVKAKVEGRTKEEILNEIYEKNNLDLGDLIKQYSQGLE